MRAHVIRPGYFRPLRDYPQDWTNQRAGWESAVDRVVGPLFTWLTPSLVTPLDEMSKVALEIVKGRWPDMDMFRNKNIRELARDL
jgi:hypothetical protein